jgi:AcrR family transcriptional regulator
MPKKTKPEAFMIDRRFARTRALLQDALIALIPERGYGAVTVEDICRKANVGRSTFYTHYTGKDHLRSATIDTHGDALAQASKAAGRNANGRVFAFSLPMLEHAHALRSLHRALLGSGDDSIHEEFRVRIRRAIRDELSGRRTPSGDVCGELAVRFVAGAFLAVLAWWIEANVSLSPSQVDEVFQKMAARAVDTSG